MNSANERAVLFFIDLLSGTLIRKIDTGAGSAAASNGMATPRGWDLDGNGTVDLVYAGDLLGVVGAEVALLFGGTFRLRDGGFDPRPKAVEGFSADVQMAPRGAICLLG